jgi:hypothetical protein
MAKRTFVSRYPQYEGEISKILANYDPNAVEYLRNSLRTEVQKLKMEGREEPEQIKGYGPGTMLMKGEEQIGQVPFAPTKPDKDEWEVFESEDGADQIYVKKGGKIPEGYKKVMGKGTTLTVNTGDLSKTTKAGLEKDIMEGVRNIQSFQNTRKLYKPEYLTLFGKTDKIMAEAADKAGISTKNQKALIRSRSKWFRQAKADFIAYRKWATGVAGGEKELAEIATSFPDPVKNSPTQYSANLDNIEETTKRVLMTNSEFLRSGIDMDQPLDAILEQAKAIGVGGPPGVSGKGGSAPPSPQEVIIEFDAQGNRISP